MGKGMAKEGVKEKEKRSEEGTWRGSGIEMGRVKERGQRRWEGQGDRLGQATGYVSYMTCGVVQRMCTVG